MTKKQHKKLTDDANALAKEIFDLARERTGGEAVTYSTALSFALTNLLATQDDPMAALGVFVFGLCSSMEHRLTTSKPPAKQP